MTLAAVSSSSLSVAIIGAGIAGLCLAQALNAAGMDVQVYERDPSAVARRQGYRITVDQHGLGALQACLPAPLFEVFLATSSEPGDRFSILNAQLKEAVRLTFKPDRSGNILNQPRQADRATLRTVLLHGLEHRTHFGKVVERVQESPDDVKLFFTDGETAQAQVVVGADGVGSVLRRQLLPDASPVNTGFTALYGKTPVGPGSRFELPEALKRGGAIVIGPPGKVFFCTAMRFQTSPDQAFADVGLERPAPTEDDYVMWAVIVPQHSLPPDVLSLAPETLHQQALLASGDYHPLMRQMVASASLEYTLAVPILKGTAPAQWPLSRVVLLGDAVHVMPPFGAHGGNTALRDAALLSHTLQEAVAHHKNLPQALQLFERQMTEYAFKEVGQADAMMRRSVGGGVLTRWLLLHALPGIRSLGNPTSVNWA